MTQLNSTPAAQLLDPFADHYWEEKFPDQQTRDFLVFTDECYCYIELIWQAILPTW
jgi:hypothetical protein